jgi:hypothetical protein
MRRTPAPDFKGTLNRFGSRLVTLNSLLVNGKTGVDFDHFRGIE